MENMEIKKIINRILDLLDRIKDIDEEQRREIRELKMLLLPPLVPGSGELGND